LSLVPVCFLALFLNRLGKFNIAGILVCIVMIFALNFDIYNAGGITSDLAAVAYPVIVIVCALIFGKKGVLIYSAFSISSASILWELEKNRMLPNNFGRSDIYDILTVVILIISTALVLMVILENAEQNLKQIQQDDATLRVSYELTLERLVKALEFRDRETEQHSQRVVEMSVYLARHMGLNNDDLINFRRGALLHDIGKLAVPDHILLKPGPLSDEEWMIMREHPVKAMEILLPIPFLKSALDIPYSHHENWDGSGYPLGLKGEEIPLFARIFTVIDHWEALTSDRPYRKAWTIENAIKYIRDNSGKIYDPEIVDSFLHLLKTAPSCFMDVPSN
jgi:putative nucleotidyltransferase with HDIG domain